MTAGVPAIILVSYATGTTPQRLSRVISQRTASAVPVFHISDNIGGDHGILGVVYGTQTASASAGAIRIEKVNVSSLDLVLAAIQDELDAGKSCRELAEEVRQRYVYKMDAPKPRAEWDIPEAVDREEYLLRATLRRLRNSDAEIERQMRVWKYGDDAGQALRNCLQQ